MDLTALPLPPKIWAATPAAAQALIVSLEARVRELEGRLRQDSSNPSRPASSDPPQTPVRPKALPSGRKRGGQSGRHGAFRGPSDERCATPTCNATSRPWLWT